MKAYVIKWVLGMALAGFSILATRATENPPDVDGVTHVARDSSGQPVALQAAAIKVVYPVKTDLQLLDGRHLVFDPTAMTDLQRLLQQLEQPIKTSKTPPANATLREQSTVKQYRRGLQELRLLAQAVVKNPQSADRAENVHLMQEVAAAINNNWRERVPKKIEGITVGWLLIQQAQRPIGKGTAPATNLRAGQTDDLSKLDPMPSAFWQRPLNIPAANLYYGFGRTSWLNLEEPVCHYVRAKDNYGRHAGFEVGCNGSEVKLKFAELSSEPLTTRIFFALGFHADPTDYAVSAKVKYDRRIFTEFNSRQKLATTFTGFGIPTYTLNLQPQHDPFAFIQWAVLRDGRRWNAAELKQHLLRKSGDVHPETLPANFIPEAESSIDYLITVPANVQVKDPALKNVGPWDYDQLDHPGRRELRGAGLLAAWLGFFDSRFDNTKLRIRETEHGDRVLEYFSDLGGGMGETSGFLYQKGERPNLFPWTFTQPPLFQGPNRMARPLRIENFRAIEPNTAFANMTIDDARWMARLIAQLTEQQLSEALIASGYDSATARLYLEKLISRRDQMVKDLGLGGEISLLRPAGIDRQFSYIPAQHGLFNVKLPDGSELSAPMDEKVVINGRLIENPAKTAKK